VRRNLGALADVPVPSLFFSLRLRFMLWYGAILALILVACSGAVYLTEQRSLLAQIDSHLAVRVQQWAGDYNARTGRFATKYDPDSEQGTEVVLLLTPEGQVVQRFSAGRLSGVKVPWDQTVRMLATVARGGTSSVHEYGLLQTTPAAPSKGGITPLTVNRAAIYRMSGMPLRVGNRVAALLVVGIRSDVAQQLTTLTRTLETVVPLVLILCVGSGYWLVNRALRPIRLITRTANQISATDLSKRLNLRSRDELGQLGATLDHMFSRLAAAVERQRQFTADAGHELRTPLAVVDLEATRALAHRRTADQYRQTIAVIQDEAGRMTRLVNDLLTLARADSGEVAIRRTDVDLAAVVLDVLERLEPLARHNEMTVTIEALPDARVWGDQEALTRMLTNIIENALKHGAGRGTQVRLSGGLERDQDSPGLWLRVVDDGPGIAAEHLPHVCERFYRVDPARTHTTHEEGGAPATGSGLGLAITQEIIRNHGGRLGISSAEDSGVVVDIWLPTTGSPPV
jgi:signal transduction histidine kinase